MITLPDRAMNLAGGHHLASRVKPRTMRTTLVNRTEDSRSFRHHYPKHSPRITEKVCRRQHSRIDRAHRLRLTAHEPRPAPGEWLLDAVANPVLQVRALREATWPACTTEPMISMLEVELALPQRRLIIPNSTTHSSSATKRSQGLANCTHRCRASTGPTVTTMTRKQANPWYGSPVAITDHNIHRVWAAVRRHREHRKCREKASCRRAGSLPMRMTKARVTREAVGVRRGSWISLEEWGGKEGGKIGEMRAEENECIVEGYRLSIEAGILIVEHILKGRS